MEQNQQKEIRELFPALSVEVYGKKLVYLDNAATSQKPLPVLALQKEMSEHINANIHRAVHKLSIDATQLYEKGRRAVADFIGAPSMEEVIFTSGATASFNLLASCFSQRYIGPGDKVVLSESEHHSNIVPWQIACQSRGASIEIVPVTGEGIIDTKALETVLDRDSRSGKKIRIISICQISNVLGVVNPIKEIVSMAHSYDIPVAVDGAQGIVHGGIDVGACDCDFYVFSGHKIYAPTGCGILYGKRRYLEEMPPFMGGGDMVDHVSFEKTTYAEPPLKYEAGTPNFVASSCFAPALEVASSFRDNNVLKQEERTVIEYFMEELPKIGGLRLFGVPKDLSLKAPVFSMTVEGTHPTDLAQIMDKMGVAVRSGLMCAEPLVTKYSDRGMLRASFLPYNTVDEAEYFVRSLGRAVNMVR